MPGVTKTSIRSVVVVNDYAYVNGGQARVAIESAISLADAGLEVSFFAACGPVDDRLESAGVEVVCLGQNDLLSEPNRLRAGLRGYWNNASREQLRRHLQEFNPSSSVVHCHGFAKALSPSIGSIVTGGPLPHVYTMHEYFLACPNGGFYDFSNHEICTRRAMSTACVTTNCDSRRWTHKAWRLGRQAIVNSVGSLPRNLRHVIYISETQLRVMSPYIPVAAQMHYVPNPVCSNSKSRAKAEDNRAFLFVGRLSREKGGMLFAQATREAGVEAVLIGDGPERAAIQQTNPAAKITGWLDPTEVERRLQLARCLVFPSLWYETFGLVAYEALSHGIPVICGSWNAATEAIKHDRNGFVVDDANVESWSKAILNVNRKIEDLSKNAYHSYWKERREPHEAVLMKVYEKVISESVTTSRPLASAM